MDGGRRTPLAYVLPVGPCQVLSPSLKALQMLWVVRAVLLHPRQSSSGLCGSCFPSWKPTDPSGDNPGSARASHSTTVARGAYGNAASRVQEARRPALSPPCSVTPSPSQLGGRGVGQITRSRAWASRQGPARNLSTGERRSPPPPQMTREEGEAGSVLASEASQDIGMVPTRRVGSDVTWISSASASWSLSRA